MARYVPIIDKVPNKFVSFFFQNESFLSIGVTSA